MLAKAGQHGSGEPSMFPVRVQACRRCGLAIFIRVQKKRVNCSPGLARRLGAGKQKTRDGAPPDHVGGSEFLHEKKAPLDYSRRAILRTVRSD